MVSARLDGCRVFVAWTLTWQTRRWVHPLHLDKGMWWWPFSHRLMASEKSSLIQARSKGLLSRTAGGSLRISFLESPEALRHGFSVSWGNDSQLGKRCWQNHTDCLILGKASGLWGSKGQIRYAVFGKRLWGLCCCLGNDLETEFLDCL